MCHNTEGRVRAALSPLESPDDEWVPDSSTELFALSDLGFALIDCNPVPWILPSWSEKAFSSLFNFTEVHC